MNKAILAFVLAAGFSTAAMAAEFKGYVIDDQLKVVGHATKVRRRSRFFHRLPESFSQIS
jgi:hypothetical protein